MYKRYKNYDKDYIIKKYDSKSDHIPRLKTIIIKFNFKDKKLIINNFKEIRDYLLQTPKISLAKTSIASFNIKKGTETGLIVSLNKNKLYNYLESYPIKNPKILDKTGQLKSEVKVLKNIGMLQISLNSDFPKFDYSFLLSYLLIPFKD